MIAIDHFGASADYETLYREFGITAEAVVQAAHETIGAAAAGEGPIENTPTESTDESDPTGDAAAGGAQSTDATQK